ncbi:hypothetical protein H4R35_002809 [Dimargaris xerosporica]|nr:hypothetical protein H4R35_002809 [Dimargaris xerosporica]
MLEIHVETVDQDPESRATRVERLARLAQARSNSPTTALQAFSSIKRFFIVPYQDHRHAIADRLALHTLLRKDASTLPRGLRAMLMPSQPRVHTDTLLMPDAIATRLNKLQACWWPSHTDLSPTSEKQPVDTAILFVAAKDAPAVANSGLMKLLVVDILLDLSTLAIQSAADAEALITTPFGQAEHLVSLAGLDVTTMDRVLSLLNEPVPPTQHSPSFSLPSHGYPSLEDWFKAFTTGPVLTTRLAHQPAVQRSWLQPQLRFLVGARPAPLVTEIQALLSEQLASDGDSARTWDLRLTSGLLALTKHSADGIPVARMVEHWVNRWQSQWEAIAAARPQTAPTGTSDPASDRSLDQWQLLDDALETVDLLACHGHKASAAHAWTTLRRANILADPVCQTYVEYWLNPSSKSTTPPDPLRTLPRPSLRVLARYWSVTFAPFDCHLVELLPKTWRDFNSELTVGDFDAWRHAAIHRRAKIPTLIRAAFNQWLDQSQFMLCYWLLDQLAPCLDNTNDAIAVWQRIHRDLLSHSASHTDTSKPPSRRKANLAKTGASNYVTQCQNHLITLQASDPLGTVHQLIALRFHGHWLTPKLVSDLLRQCPKLGTIPPKVQVGPKDASVGWTRSQRNEHQQRLVWDRVPLLLMLHHLCSTLDTHKYSRSFFAQHWHTITKLFLNGTSVDRKRMPPVQTPSNPIPSLTTFWQEWHQGHPEPHRQLWLTPLAAGVVPEPVATMTRTALVDRCHQLTDQVCLYALAGSPDSVWSVYNDLRQLCHQHWPNVFSQSTNSGTAPLVSWSQVANSYYRAVWCMLYVLRQAPFDASHFRAVLTDYLAVAAHQSKLAHHSCDIAWFFDDWIQDSLVALAPPSVQVSVKASTDHKSQPIHPPNQRNGATLAAKPATDALAQMLLTNPVLHPLLRAWVLNHWINLYSDQDTLHKFFTKQSEGIQLKAIFLERVAMHGQDHKIEHPLSTAEAVAFVVCLSYLPMQVVGWPTYAMAYVAICYTYHIWLQKGRLRLVQRDASTPTFPAEQGDQAATFLANEAARQKDVETEHFIRQALRAPQKQKGDSATFLRGIPVDVYQLIQRYYLWPINHRPAYLTTLVALTHQMLDEHLASRVSTSANGTAIDTSTVPNSNRLLVDPAFYGMTIVDVTKVLKALAMNGRMTEGLALYHHAVKAGITPELHTFTVLLRGYTGIGDAQGINWVLEQLQMHGHSLNCYVYTVMMMYALATKDPESVFNYYQDMKEAGVMPERESFQNALQAIPLFTNSDQALSHLRQVLEDIQTAAQVHGADQGRVPTTPTHQLPGSTTKSIALNLPLPSRLSQQRVAGYDAQYTDSSRAPLANGSTASAAAEPLLTTAVFNDILQAFVRAHNHEACHTLIRHFLGDTSDPIFHMFRITPDPRTFALLLRLYLHQQDYTQVKALLAHDYFQQRADAYYPATYMALFHYYSVHRQLQTAWSYWDKFTRSYLSPPVHPDQRIPDMPAVHPAVIPQTRLVPATNLVTPNLLSSFMLYYANQGNLDAVRQLLDLTFWFEGWLPLWPVAQASTPWSHDSPCQPRRWAWADFAACVQQSTAVIPTEVADQNTTSTPSGMPFDQGSQHDMDEDHDLGDVDPYMAQVSAEPAQAPLPAHTSVNTHANRQPHSTQPLVSVALQSVPFVNRLPLHPVPRYDARSRQYQLQGAVHVPRRASYAHMHLYTLAIDIYLRQYYLHHHRHLIADQTNHVPSQTLSPNALPLSAATRLVSEKPPTLETAQDHAPAARPVFALLRPDLDPDPLRATALALLCHMVDNMYLQATMVAARHHPSPETVMDRTFLLETDQWPFTMLIELYSQCGDQDRVARLHQLMRQVAQA